MPRLRAIVLALLLADASIAFVACGAFEDASSTASGSGDAGPEATVGDGGPVSPTDDAGTSAPDADRKEGGTGSFLYRKAVLEDEPLSYWRMGDVKGNGLVIPDETSAANNLTISNGAPCVGDAGFVLGAEGVFDNDPSVFFTGKCGRAVPDVSSEFAFTGNAEFTLECWARRELADGGVSGDNSYQHLISYVSGSSTGADGGSNQNGYILYLNLLASSTSASYGAPDSGASDALGPLVPPGVWGHYVMVADATNVTLYVDGVERQALPRKGELTSRTNVLFTLGKASNVERYFRGYLDEVAIYPKKLTPLRIRAHYAIVRP